MCVYIYRCLYLCVCLWARVCAFVRGHVHLWMRTCLCVCGFVDVCVFVGIGESLWWCIWGAMCLFVVLCEYACVRVCVCAFWRKGERNTMHAHYHSSQSTHCLSLSPLPAYHHIRPPCGGSWGRTGTHKEWMCINSSQLRGYSIQKRSKSNHNYVKIYEKI